MIKFLIQWLLTSSKYYSKNFNRLHGGFFIYSRMKTYFFLYLLISTSLQAGDFKSPDSIVSILFCGDVTLANHFENHVGNNTVYPFEKIPWFDDADLTMINLENPLTSRGSAVDKKFTFRALPVYAKMLATSGIDIVTLGNNHIYDFGSQGLFDTIDYLRKENIYYVGAGRNNSEARHPVIFFRKGLKIAFLGFYGTHKHSDSYPAQIDSAGTALRQLNLIEQDIRKIRNDVDLIIVNFHWGTEKATKPGDDQIAFAHNVIDFGADMIIGHHPHVLQGIEKYKNKIIAYSLGNFIFGGNSRPEYTTALLKTKISKNSLNAEVIPLKVTYWQPEKLEGNAGKAVVDSVKKLSQSFKKSIF